MTTADGSATSSVAVDGRTVTVTVTAADGRTTRTYRVTAGLAEIALPGGSAPTAGGTVAFRAAGLTPGATYRVILHSTPTDVGSVTASSDGTASGTVTIPAGTDPGTHTLTLVDAQGQAVSDPATITVSAAAVSAITATATGARHAGPAVATGGTSVAADPWPGLALAALGLAGLAAIAGRTVARRRATMRRP